MTEVEAVLFAVVGSGWVALTLTELFSVPTTLEVNTIVTVALAFRVRSPKAQENVTPAALQVPWVEVLETIVVSAGSVSLRLMAVATSGPALLTLKVYVMF